MTMELDSSYSPPPPKRVRSAVTSSFAPMSAHEVADISSRTTDLHSSIVSLDNPSAPRASSVSSKLDPRATLTLITKSTLPSFKRLTSTILPIRYPDTFYTSLLGPETKTLAFGIVATWNSAVAADSLPTKSSSGGQLVGGISCRIEPLVGSKSLRDFPEPTRNGEMRSLAEGNPHLAHVSTSPHMLYVSTLSTLSPFRGFGIGSALLEAAISHGLELMRTINEELGSTPVAGPYGNASLHASSPSFKSSISTQNNMTTKELSLNYIYGHVWEANDEAAEWYGRRGFEVGPLQSGYYRKLEPGGARIVSKAIRTGE